MSPAIEYRLLLQIYQSEQVRVVLDVWRKSFVPVDRASAVGLRHAIQVEVLDHAQNALGMSYAEARHLADRVAVARPMDPNRAPKLHAAVTWQFTPEGDDPTGEWERIDQEEGLFS